MPEIRQIDDIWADILMIYELLPVKKKLIKNNNKDKAKIQEVEVYT
mgnify:CR=1 FL=1